jgi:predicted transcriptional regulator
MKDLTRAEEQVMMILWDLKKAFVKDIIVQMPEPKPAYNTVSTIIRILEKKGVVGYEAFGKTHRYHPTMSREEYSKYRVDHVLDGYFQGSFSNLVSFFVKDRDLTVREMDELMHLVEQRKKTAQQP